MPKSQNDRFKVALQRRQERAVTEALTLTSCEGHILLDLRQRLRPRVIALQMPAVRFDAPIERIGERKPQSPLPIAPRLPADHSQHSGLLQPGALVAHPPSLVPPSRGELLVYPFP